ncbi:hypothetical protein JB92DRAFT_366079 [Gautieria morchelliformis]|nr:hypothetical protein JB92DRAFT_366079 [Gautieria morchelliformis]
MLLPRRETSLSVFMVPMHKRAFQGQTQCTCPCAETHGLREAILLLDLWSGIFDGGHCEEASRERQRREDISLQHMFKDFFKERLSCGAPRKLHGQTRGAVLNMARTAAFLTWHALFYSFFFICPILRLWGSALCKTMNTVPYLVVRSISPFGFYLSLRSLGDAPSMSVPMWAGCVYLRLARSHRVPAQTRLPHTAFCAMDKSSV